MFKFIDFNVITCLWIGVIYPVGKWMFYCYSFDSTSYV